jgi:hypothetical protein
VFDAGLTVSVGGATVIGFSLTNSEVAAGSGVLTVLSFSDITAATTELSLGNFGALTSADGTVYDASASGSIDHPSDCAGDYYGSAVEDECGECGGAGIADGACDCAGNVADCAGECGGSAAEDECGVCNGDGAAEGFDCDGNCVDSGLCGEVILSFGAVSEGSVEVLYSSSVAIGGFQFTVSGVSLTGADSDLSPDVNFSADTGIVLGFSFTGDTLPAGDGALASFEFTASADDSIVSLEGVTVSSADGVTLASSGPGSNTKLPKLYNTSTEPSDTAPKLSITSPHTDAVTQLPSQSNPSAAPSPLHTPHSSSTAEPPHSPAHKSTLPAQSHAPSAIPAPPHSPHSSSTAEP